MAITYNSTNRTEHAYIDHPERMRLLEECIGFTGIVIEILDKRKGTVRKKRFDEFWFGCCSLSA